MIQSCVKRGPNEILKCSKAVTEAPNTMRTQLSMINKALQMSKHIGQYLAEAELESLITLATGTFRVFVKPHGLPPL